MGVSRCTKILILADPAAAARWNDILRGLDADIWIGRDQVPADDGPEIILTNLRPSDPFTRENIGVITVGAGGPADVRLPPDCTSTELSTACHLLAQVVRLRRERLAAREIQKRLSAEAMTDPLTGLPNRRAWDVALPERMMRGGGAKGCLCVAMLDLDEFKAINDTLGHSTGDEVLRSAARAMSTNLRHADFLARLGGDEFGLLLFATNPSVPLAVLERIRRRLPARMAETAAPHLTVSAGYKLSNGEASDKPEAAERLFQAADAALRRAKLAGRNRVMGG